MLGVWYIILVLLAVVVTCVMISLLIWFAVDPMQKIVGPTPAINTGDVTSPNFIDQAYAQSVTGGFVVIQEKPFVVKTVRQSITRNAFVFTNVKIVGEFTTVSRGFLFTVNEPQKIVSLQVVDQFFNLGDRYVGIYNYDQRTLLFATWVSKTENALTQGFRTFSLTYQNQIPLLPGITYSCVGLMNPGDYYALSTDPYALVTSEINFLGVGEAPGSELTLPSSFDTSLINNAPFASFQLQKIYIDPLRPALKIDTQYPSMPLFYISGFNFDVDSTGSILTVQPGFCAAADPTLCIYSYSTIRFSTQNLAMLANTWYAVYVSVIEKQCVIQITTNYADNNLQPDRYTRRIGFVKTEADPTKLIQVVQYGPEVLRSYNFIRFDQLSILKTMGNNNVEVLLLDMLPPTATTCLIQVQMSYAPEVDPDTVEQIQLDFNQDEGQILFGRHQSFQLATIDFSINTATIPPIVTVKCSSSFVGPKFIFVFSVLSFTEDL